MKSSAGYWIGGGLLVVAVIGSFLYGVLSLQQAARTVEAFQRVDLPGAETVELEARKYVIYAEGPAGEAGRPRIDIEITDSVSGSALAVRRYTTSLTYSFGTAGTAIATVTPAEAGSYQVRASSPDERTAALALGESVAGGIVRSILGSFVIGGVFGVSGLLLLIVTGVRHLIRRSRAPVGT